MVKRSILTKLILAFLLVSVIAIASLLVITSYNTGREFNTYLADQDQTTIISHFTNYYEENQSWQNVDATLPGLLNSLKIKEPDPNHPSFTLADASEVVVISSGYYKKGDVLLQNDKRDSILITDQGVTVGYLVMRNRMPRPGPEPNPFIERVNQRLIVSGGIALAFALIFAVVISRVFTQPIRELTRAAREVADGNLEQTVNVRSQDELGELTRSFNDMTAKLSRLMESRKQMTADIAHELRTPISIILGHAEGIHDGVLEASPETIEIIREEAIRLEHLVNDLRVLALSDAGELTLNPTPTSPYSLMKNIHDLFKYQAQARGLQLVLDCPANLPDVMIDSNRLVQVFSNMVDNASRITPAGGTITLSAFETDHQIEFVVADTGPGIRPEDLERIFDRLYRTDQSRQRDKGGSGLGLAIAKTLVEQHGGKIWAESTLGVGTSMHIRLPIHTDTDGDQ
jgi:signal transduction histidine kinase